MNEKQNKLLKMLLDADNLISEINFDIEKAYVLNNTISNVFFDLDPKNDGCYILYSFERIRTMNNILTDYVVQIRKKTEALCKAYNRVVDIAKEK